MPKQARHMRAGEVSRWRKPGLRAVGGTAGLCLQISPSGARSWVLRVSIGGRVRHLGLGAYPGVTLAAARAEARDLRRQVRAGRA